MSDPTAPGLKTKLAVLAAAMFVAFGLCEIGARLMFPAPQDPGREPRILFQSQPWGGFVHLPNQQGWMDDGFITVNSLGLRGPEPESPRVPGHPRVLAIGDSTTFGLGVNDQETYVARLQRELRSINPGSEAINGAISGFNLELETRLLRHFAPVLRPDIVLIGFFWNDLPYEAKSPNGDPLTIASTSPTAAIAPPDQSSETSGAEHADFVPRVFRIGEPPSRLNRLLRSSRLLYVARQRLLGFLQPSAEGRNAVEWETALLEGRKTPTIDAGWAEITSGFREIARMGQRDGFDAGVVIMPIRAQVEQDFAKAEYQTRASAAAQQAGLFVIDPLNAFRSEANRASLFIPYDRMHYSARGNDVLARAVFDTLRERPAIAALTH